MRKENLLDGDGSANFFELSLSSFSFFFWQTFFDHLRSVVYNFLSFLEAETGEFTNDLDDFDLLIANGGEFYIEFGLFFFSSDASSSTSANAVTMTELSIYSPILAVFQALTKFCQ